MTLTERYAQDEVMKRKAEAFDNMQMAARQKQIAGMAYGQGLSDHNRLVEEAARQRMIEEEMARRAANEAQGLPQTFVPYSNGLAGY